MGNAGEQLVRSCVKRLKRDTQKEVKVKFVVTYNTTKLSFFADTKDPITKLASSFAAYHFRCLGCYHNNIAKTERTLGKGLMNIVTLTETT